MITFNSFPSVQPSSDKTSLSSGHSTAEEVPFYLNPLSSTLLHLQWRLLYEALPKIGLISRHSYISHIFLIAFHNTRSPALNSLVFTSLL